MPTLEEKVQAIALNGYLIEKKALDKESEKQTSAVEWEFREKYKNEVEEVISSINLDSKNCIRKIWIQRHWLPRNWLITHWIIAQCKEQLLYKLTYSWILVESPSKIRCDWIAHYWKRWTSFTSSPKNNSIKESGRHILSCRIFLLIKLMVY